MKKKKQKIYEYEYLKRDEKFFWAYCKELPDCTAYGSSMEDLKKNINKVVKAYLEKINE